MVVTQNNKRFDTLSPAESSTSEQYIPPSTVLDEPPPDRGRTMAMLTLSHTPTEHKLYQVMFAQATAAKTRVCAFSTRRLMALTELSNYSAIRRGINGLINKRSIENHKVACCDIPQRQASVYLIFTPEEIFARRSTADFSGCPKKFGNTAIDDSYAQAAGGLTVRYKLSRREAEVALCCAEGLTNIQIGERLYISSQTVKFHMRHIFIKYGVRRRTELVSHLLTEGCARQP